MRNFPDLYFYDSLRRERVLFEPLYAGRVGLYVCGPTVSGESHLGHARPFITFDILYRLLLYVGYQVRYVRNITDAGHFEEEGREAEDKVSKKAALERLEPMELTEKYTRLFHEAMRNFNCLEPSIEPRATGHITEQIAMIEDLLTQNYAYEVNGSVYFDTQKYIREQKYGILSGRNPEELLANTRNLTAQSEKRSPLDFALWKHAPKEHLMQWQSPWGKGFPGWHIECSAMSAKYLGAQFDIHGGGIDLQFPHHECEIAQSTIAGGVCPARYWLHNNMITINGKKMGKSYNNIITLRELFAGTHPLLSRPYSPLSVRFFILQTHYRSTLDFSDVALEAASRGFARLVELDEFVRSQDFLIDGAENSTDTALEAKIRVEMVACPIDLANDLNTAKVLAHFFNLMPYLNALRQNKDRILTLGRALRVELAEFFRVYLVELLGLRSAETRAETERLNVVLRILIELRNEARAKKDFQTADKIRQELAQQGIFLKDGKDGASQWTIGNDFSEDTK